jgi:hypothetical protein
MEETPRSDEQQAGAPEGEAAGPAGDAAPGGNGTTDWKIGGEQGSAWLAQLQAMIDHVAEQAFPVVREIAAKSAELAAVAAEHAGPLAQRAANVTTEVGQRVAARGKEMAADLRRGAEHPGSDHPGDTEA